MRAIEPFSRAGFTLVPQSNVEGQVRPDAPVVLYEERIVVRGLCARRVQVVTAARWQTEQESRDILTERGGRCASAGIGEVGIELIQADGVAVADAAIALLPKVDSHFEGMAAGDFVECAEDLKDVERIAYRRRCRSNP